MELNVKDQLEILDTLITESCITPPYGYSTDEYVEDLESGKNEFVQEIFSGASYGRISKEIKKDFNDISMLRMDSTHNGIFWKYENVMSKLIYFGREIYRRILSLRIDSKIEPYKSMARDDIETLYESMCKEDSTLFTTDLKLVEGFQIPLPNKTLTFQKNMKINKYVAKLADAGRALGVSHTPWYTSVKGDGIDEWVSDTYKEIEYLQIELSKLKQQNNIKGFLNLSSMPEDLLTVSDNSSNWSSCLSISEDGEYSGGAIELASSKMSVVAFLSGSTPYIVGDHKLENKQWRRTGFVKDHILTFQKAYPFYSAAMDEELTKMIEEETPYRVISREALRIRMIKKYGSSYYLDETFPTLNFIHKDYYDEYFDEEEIVSKEIDFELDLDSKCLGCGYETDGKILCDDCMDVQFCDDCGGRTPSDEMISFEYGDGGGWTDSVCEYCAESDSDYQVCEDCGVMVYEPNVVEEEESLEHAGYYCSSCYEYVMNTIKDEQEEEENEQDN